MDHAHSVRQLPRRLVAAAVLGLGALAVSLPAAAQHHHGPRVGVGVYLGGPVYRPYWGPGPYWYGPGYYPPYYAYPPYYSYPPVVTVPAQPPVYVERQDQGAQPAPPPAPSAQALEPGYWYYCRNPAGYYPNVAECPGGWERVAPQPQGTAPQR